MSRLLLAAGALTGALAGGLATRFTAVGGALVGLAIGLAGAVVVGLVERRRLSAISDVITGWVDEEPPAQRRPIPVPRDPDWHRLGRALNVLGTDYERVRALPAREPAAYRDLVASLAAPSLLFSATGTLSAANDTADSLFQIPRTGPASPIQVFGNVMLASVVTDTLRDRMPRQVTAEIGERYVMVSVSPLGDGALVLATDRTEERRVDEVRRDFVVNASHELKTPVTSIQTLVEALAVAADRQPDRMPALVERLGGEAERLVNLVRDLLDLRRLEETASIERTEVVLRAVVAEVVAGLAAEAQSHDVTVVTSGDADATVRGNRDDLALAVRNLVVNAIRYNRRRGRVTIEIAAAVDGGMVLTVTDTGVGIPRADLGRIFERFYRVEDARSRETGGTGLGLAIVRHVVERHSGSISVDSLLGKGTTFTVRLPKAPPT